MSRADYNSDYQGINTGMTNARGLSNLPIEELLDAHKYWLEEYMNN